MDHIIAYLKQLELSDVEAKMYLTLLKTGPINVRELAESTAIKRTTAYLYIDQLVEKGLVMKVVKGAQKLIAANPPQSIQHLVENKLAAAKKAQEALPEVLKTITTTFPKFTEIDTFDIKHYKSMTGINKIYDEILMSKDLCSYIKLIGSGSLFEDNMVMLDEAFKKNPKLKVRELIDDSPLSRYETGINLKRHPGKYFRKFLPKEMELTAEDVHIYDGKVAIIHFVNKINAVVLQDADYYNNAKAIFEYLWKSLPEVK